MKKSCSSAQCRNCDTVMTFLSIALGLAMLFFGLSKLAGLPEVVAFLGNSAHALGLTFLSIIVWGRLAIIGEIVAGIMLIAGCKVGKRVGAFVTLIIMIVAAGGAHGWTIAGGAAKAYIFGAVALLILICGGGKGLLDLFWQKKMW